MSGSYGWGAGSFFPTGVWTKRPKLTREELLQQEIDADPALLRAQELVERQSQRNLAHQNYLKQLQIDIPKLSQYDREQGADLPQSILTAISERERIRKGAEPVNNSNVQSSKQQIPDTPIKKESNEQWRIPLSEKGSLSGRERGIQRNLENRRQRIQAETQAEAEKTKEQKEKDANNKKNQENSDESKDNKVKTAAVLNAASDIFDRSSRGFTPITRKLQEDDWRLRRGGWR